MPKPNGRPIEERLETLEAAVENLQNTLTGLIEAIARRDKVSGDLADVRPITTKPLRPRRLQPSIPGPFTTLLSRGPQYWISRVGIGLLLFGVAFLFKYAVDQGWLTPEIRVVFGLALGAVLATIGFRVHTAQRWFSQIVLGGAAATWYITGFAAFQLFQLVSHPVAFAFMVLVTVFLFWASVRQDESVLAVLAAVGGLGTPFLLYTEAGSVPALIAYTSILLVGTSAIYLFKGWQSLLWVTALGGWLVLVLAFGEDPGANRVALQSGVMVVWLLFWVVPVGREVLARREPSKWSYPKSWVLEPREVGVRHNQLAVLLIATAVATLYASHVAWRPTDDTVWGVIALVGAGLYGLVAWYLSRPDGVPALRPAHIITGAVLTALGISLLFRGHAEIVLFAVEALALHLLAKRLGERSVGTAGHLLFGLVALWLAQRLTAEPPPETAIQNWRALADAGVIAALLLATRWINRRIAPVYWVAAHLAILAWLWRELSVLPVGDGIVTGAWGVYSLGLLFFMPKARTVGLATLFATAGKLVLFDLSQVEPIWRILLFLSFGAVFLALGYYFRSGWNRGEENGSPQAGGREGGR
ncbi:MAG: DUF2339 domain-containing protein [Gemmatimonadales bacterium]|nr:DUF2339 domain-containing protein [Gemmatimonadales bacterium]